MDLKRSLPISPRNLIQVFLNSRIPNLTNSQIAIHCHMWNENQEPLRDSPSRVPATNSFLNNVTNPDSLGRKTLASMNRADSYDSKGLGGVSRAASPPPPHRLPLLPQPKLWEAMPGLRLIAMKISSPSVLGNPLLKPNTSSGGTRWETHFRRLKSSGYHQLRVPHQKLQGMRLMKEVAGEGPCTLFANQH